MVFRWFNNLIAALLMVVLLPLTAVAEDEPVDANEKLRIGIVGDVMAQGLSLAIMRQLEADPNLKIEHLNFAKGSSGFVRDDYYDWNAVLPGILEDNIFDYILVFLGSNDRQSIRVKGKNFKVATPTWREEYTHRVDQFLEMIKDKQINIIWLGQPIARSTKFSTDMAMFNEIYRQNVESLGEAYFDVWNLFANEDGKYAQSGPDVTGQIRKLRSGNGIHFTKAGYDKLAFQVLNQIQNLENDDGSLASNDEGELVEAEKYDLSKNPEGDTIIVERRGGEEEKPPLQTLEPENIFSNDVIGDEFSLSQPLPEEANIPLWKKVLKNGYVIEPEFGRSDDFSWPRN